MHNARSIYHPLTTAGLVLKLSAYNSWNRSYEPQVRLSYRRFTYGSILGDHAAYIVSAYPTYSLPSLSFGRAHSYFVACRLSIAPICCVGTSPIIS